MESGEEDEVIINKLVKKTKKIEIADQDVSEWEDIQSSFRNHFHPQSVSRFYKTSGSKRNPVCLFTDLFCDGKRIICGLDNGICKPIDLSGGVEERLLVDIKSDRIEANLSCIRCSRTSPHIFFSSNSSDGIIQQWDIRQSDRKPSQKFTSAEAGNADKTKVKPILQFDVSCNDQLLCGGTEMVNEDSYLLFWDVRSSKMMGAYWESHCDDVTAVKFHPDQIHSLASGSTDGLLNVFNLMEPAEEDALLYSFNTNSSVDRVYWFCPFNTDPKIVCVTHTNEVQVWNTETGDPVVEISRKSMAEAMLRSNPDAVYITGCYNTTQDNNSSINIMANSLSGGNTRLIQLNEAMKPVPLGIFMDQTSIVQTAQYVPLVNQWLTFDELGTMKIWKSAEVSGKNVDGNRSKLVLSKREERRRVKRHKPYNKD